MRIHTTVLMVFGLALGCGADKRYGVGIDDEPGGLASDADADADADTDADADHDGDSETEDGAASIQGMVTVELYTTDDDGGRDFLSWEDAVGEDGDFPFGSIFVAAFRTNEDGRETYFDQHTVTRPRTMGDYYSLSVNPDLTDFSNVYASVDIRGDGIMASDEPIGIYPEDIVIEKGTEADDVNISILVDWDRWGPGGWGWRDAYGGGGGDGCDVISLSGPVDITVPYGGGNGMAMMLDAHGNGPWKYDPFTPIATPDGAEADFQMGVCGNAGQMQLVGAYDSNGNGLIDPADLWGAYVAEAGVNGNPIEIGSERMDDLNMEIPIDDGQSSLNVVPFVHLEGTVSSELTDTIGELSEEDSDATLYVVALKYRMNSEFPVSSMDNAYDVRVWGPDALGDIESVNWDLIVPANTIVYLWAFVDADGDGMVNEVGEPIASGGADGAGALPIGDEGQSGIDLGLRIEID